jgi:GNAT superfamily N-acetyltransferase
MTHRSDPDDATARPNAEREPDAAVRIVAYDPARPDHRIAFRDLNLAWIEAHFVVEPRDRHELDDPVGHILDAGGEIFMAVADGREGSTVLGTCALLVEPDGAFELAKMAVHPSARGRGVGRALGEAAIAAARARGAARVDLLSNTALAPAIALYRALGFVEAPLPPTEYARANIKMTLDLSSDPPGPLS